MTEPTPDFCSSCPFAGCANCAYQAEVANAAIRVLLGALYELAALHLAKENA